MAIACGKLAQRIAKTMTLLSAPLLDLRRPAVDVMGALADLQIRRDDLELLREHVRKSYPDVTSIRCGFRRREHRPFFTIHFAPFSETRQVDHWPLGDWMKMAFRLAKAEFYYQPPMPPETISAAVTIYAKTG